MLNLDSPVPQRSRHCGFCRASALGFTLTELLIVITIILILAALLIPLGRNLREGALAAKCAGHMRQCAATCTLFTAEHGGRLPRLHVTNKMAVGELGLEQLPNDERIVNNATVYFWPDMMGKYTDGVDFYSCPKLTVPAIKGAGGGRSDRIALGIGINYPHMAPNAGSPEDGPESYKWVRMDQVPEPGRIVWFTDSAGDVSGPWKERVETPEQGSLYFRSPSSNGVMPRHGGKINVAFADGHVASVWPQEIDWGDREPSGSFIGYSKF